MTNIAIYLIIYKDRLLFEKIETSVTNLTPNIEKRSGKGEEMGENYERNVFSKREREREREERKRRLAISGYQSVIQLLVPSRCPERHCSILFLPPCRIVVGAKRELIRYHLPPFRDPARRTMVLNKR